MARETFLTIFKKEEQNTSAGMRLSEIMDRAYASGATWFFHGLDSINAMYHFFERKLRLQFPPLPVPEMVDGCFAVFLWKSQTV